MDESQANRGLKSSPQLLNLIPNGDHWMVRDTREEGGTKFGAPEEKKLELSLCPPGTQEEHRLPIKDNTERILSTYIHTYIHTHIHSSIYIYIIIIIICSVLP